MTCRCEVCKDEGHKTLFSKRGYEFVRCLSCGHVYVHLDISDERLYQWYAQDFYSDGAYVDYVGDRAILEKNFRRFIALLREYSAGGLLFEIGCAYGFFLELARQHWQVRGVDINAEAVSYARERLGLNVTCGDFLDLVQENGACDVVTMWDTIEHLRSPSDYVSKISRILRSGGILALTTGDVGSLVARVRGRRWRLYYPPFHLHYFSRRTITRLLERYGLRVVEIRAVGFYRSLDLMLYRVFFHEKPRISRVVYLLAKQAGLTERDVYLNLFDIMLVIARKATA